MMSVCAQWRTGRQGTLAPVEQAKLWALREVLRKQGEDDLKRKMLLFPRTPY